MHLLPRVKMMCVGGRLKNGHEIPDSKENKAQRNALNDKRRERMSNNWSYVKWGEAVLNRIPY